MTLLALPINLTTCALDQRDRASAGATRRILSQPNLCCDHLDAAELRAEGKAAATQDEIYIVLAGHGSMRCADDSLTGVTVGDVIYVELGTRRSFEDLSRKFLVLRLFLFVQEKVRD